LTEALVSSEEAQVSVRQLYVEGEGKMTGRSGFKVFAVTAIVALVAFASGLASAAEFSADMVHKFGEMTKEGKIYVKGKKMRMEGAAAGHGITIMNEDTGVAWVLQPGQKTYLEMKRGAQMAGPAQSDEQELAKIADKKFLGTETVNGYQCEKYLYTYHDKSLGTLTQWYSKKLGCPIKMVQSSSRGQSSFEYRNIKEGGVTDSLFQVPAGYTKMEMPAMPPGMGKGMGQGMGKPKAY
jgi:outer membrane lipoprotein-sorting protein